MGCIMPCMQNIRNPKIKSSFQQLYFPYFQESALTVAMIKNGVVKTTSIENIYIIINISGSKRSEAYNTTHCKILNLRSHQLYYNYSSFDIYYIFDLAHFALAKKIQWMWPEVFEIATLKIFESYLVGYQQKDDGVQLVSQLKLHYHLKMPA